MAKAYYDMDISSFDISGRVLDELEALGPFGHGNPRPCFRIRDAKIKKSTLVGKEKKEHLKLILEKDGAALDAIHFFHADKSVFLSGKNEFIGRLCRNDYNNMPQLIIETVKPAYRRDDLKAYRQVIKTSAARGFVEEVGCLSQQPVKEGNDKTRVNDRIEKRIAESPFGSLILFRSLPALAAVFDLPAVQYGFREDRLEIFNPKASALSPFNAIAMYGPNTRERLKDFRHVFLVGLWQDIIQDINIEGSVYLYDDEDLREKYKSDAADYYMAREALLNVFFRLKKKPAPPAFLNDAELYAHLSNRLGLKEEKLRFAIRVFTELGLIAWAKSDKIQLIINEIRQKRQLSESGTFAAFRRLLASVPDDIQQTKDNE